MIIKASNTEWSYIALEKVWLHINRQRGGAKIKKKKNGGVQDLV